MTTFELIQLPYAPNALEPAISAETISFHHGKHLQTYVNNLNALLPGSGFEEATLEEIVKRATGALFNNAGQVLNHNLYFSQFDAPKADNRPGGRIGNLINAQFGSFEEFKEAFEKRGATLFGSGWLWLSADVNQRLVITQEPNASNPLTKDLRPLLTFDLWEHAYYLDYQNRRLDHFAALWQIVNWKVVSARL